MDRQAAASYALLYHLYSTLLYVFMITYNPDILKMCIGEGDFVGPFGVPDFMFPILCLNST